MSKLLKLLTTCHLMEALHPVVLLNTYNNMVVKLLSSKLQKFANEKNLCVIKKM